MDRPPGAVPSEPTAGPVRTCIGCRRRRAPEEMLRVVRTASGGLRRGRGEPGRGAWLCPDPACLAAARRRRAFAKALRAPVRDEAIESLGEDLVP